MRVTLAAKLDTKSLAGGTSFEPIGGSWRTAEAWHFQRPAEAIGEGIASVSVENLGLKRSWRKAECTMWQNQIP